MLKAKPKITKIKKAVTKKATKKSLPIVESHVAFWSYQGPVLRSLIDLGKFLAIATDEQFSYHTKRDGNDFARWTKDVLQDATCATALEKAKTKSAALSAVRLALTRYNV
ncbi:MAG: hypothetical protein AAB455_00350 [Patescibacteria group bacterium]